MYNIIDCPPYSSPIDLVSSQANTQRIVKQIKNLIAALPESKRPKSDQELREFLQKYSSLISSRLPQLQQQQQPAVNSGYSLSSKTTGVTPPPFADNLAKSRTQALTNQPSLTATRPPPVPSGSSRESSQTAVTGSRSQSANVNVAEHFKNSLLSSSASRPSLASQGLPSRSPQHSSLSVPQDPPARAPPPSVRVPVFIPQLPTSGPSSGTETTKHLQQQRQQQFSAGTMHAPITTQFDHTPNPLPPPTPPPGNTPSSQPSMASNQTPIVTTSSTGIQAGIAMPLPPGLTPETLNVLCRLSDNDLHKLKLPPALLSAIKVWKVRQFSTKSKVSCMCMCVCVVKLV